MSSIFDVYAQDTNASDYWRQRLQQQKRLYNLQYEEQYNHRPIHPQPDIIPLKLQTAVDRLRSEIKEWCGGKLNSY